MDAATGLAGGLAAGLAGVDALARELTLFACVGFLVGGIDDVIVDFIYLLRRRPRRRIAAPPRRRLAVFVPAWDEAPVIAAMIGRALARFAHPDFRLYLGCYPNDPGTIAAAAPLALRDPRLRLVVNARPGPTTKGDNLNSLWRALLRDEAADGWRADGIVLHDAEDMIHPDELAVFDALLADHALVQLPVVPLIAPHSRWVSAHYADEFAEVHPKNLAVRQAIGAALPLAGTGCALRRDVLDRLAARRAGEPFDAASLVEDYELGLTVAALGGRGCFREALNAGGQLVCVRAFFPATLAAAARQKARWIAGIALLGWDRLGWSRLLDVREHWMRMRDRRALLAILVIAAAYCALAATLLSAALHALAGRAMPGPPPPVATLLAVNGALLAWRLAMRGVSTGRTYGWREGVRALPRMFVSNFVALMAVRRALRLYVAHLRGAPLRWDKTAHFLPATLAE